MFLERALEVSTAVRHMAEQTFQFKADRTRFVAWRAPRRIIESLTLFDELSALDCPARYRGFARLTPATSPDVCWREAGR